MASCDAGVRRTARSERAAARRVRTGRDAPAAARRRRPAVGRRGRCGPRRRLPRPRRRGRTGGAARGLPARRARAPVAGRSDRLVPHPRRRQSMGHAPVAPLLPAAGRVRLAQDGRQRLGRGGARRSAGLDREVPAQRPRPELGGAPVGTPADRARRPAAAVRRGAVPRQRGRAVDVAVGALPRRRLDEAPAAAARRAGADQRAAGADTDLDRRRPLPRDARFSAADEPVPGDRGVAGRLRRLLPVPRRRRGGRADRLGADAAVGRRGDLPRRLGRRVLAELRPGVRHAPGEVAAAGRAARAIGGADADAAAGGRGGAVLRADQRPPPAARRGSPRAAGR